MKNGARQIVVTGGGGFIGSHLTERLLKEGFRVKVIDDFSTGREDNLAEVRGHERLEVISMAVSVVEDLAAIVGRSSFVFHLAAAVGVDLVVKSPIRTIQTNLRETEAILEAASGRGVPVLLASTSEVYGKSAKDSFGEEDDLLIGPPTLGRWSYACSKLMDEFLTMAYAKDRRLPVIVVRLFNTVGPRQTGRYGMVLPRFLHAAREHADLEVYGDGSQTRCFCDVMDTIEALIRLMHCPSARGEVVNVGSREEISILELARQVIQTTRSRSGIQFIPYAEAYAPGFEDMRRRKPEVEKLRRLTGFTPQTSLLEILRRMPA